MDDNNTLALDWSASRDYTPIIGMGFAGQIGTLRRGDGPPSPVYDPDIQRAPVWEIPIGATTFAWRRRELCYGAPPGSCHNATHGEVLCYTCTLRAQEQAERDQADTVRADRLAAAFVVGALPAWWRGWMPPALTGQQAAALTAIDSVPDACVWLYGKPGRGKTVLACTLLYHEARRCRSIGLAKSDTLNDSRMDRTLQRYLCCANTLLIDDIEKGVYSEPGVAAIHAVLDRRHDARLRTIITSERTPAQVHETFIALSGTQYGTSTLSRLAVGRLKPLVLELTGKNLRKDTD